MKTATLTITGKIGPGNTVTTLVLHEVTKLHFNIGANTIYVACREGEPVFDYNATATVTYTISGNAATITIA